MRSFYLLFVLGALALGGLSACSKIDPEVLAIFSKPAPEPARPHEPEPRGIPVPDLLRLGVILDENAQPVVPASLMKPGRGLFEGMSVSRAAPAPDGGWFVTGVFTAYGGSPVSNFAKIREDGTLDVTWNLEIDGPVMELFFEGGRLYLSGEFSAVNGVRRNYLAAVDPVTRQVVGPDFKLDGIVTALKSLPSGDLVMGGYFEKAGVDLSATSVAFDLQTNSRKAEFATVSTGFMSQVESDGSGGFVVAGWFETLDGKPRRGIARLAPDGQVLSWKALLPEQGNVMKMKRFGNVLYLGVSRSSPVMGPSELWLMAVEVSSGTTLWSRKIEGGGFVSDLEKIGDHLYVGGSLDDGNGQVDFLAAFALSDGTRKNWSPNLDGSVRGLSVLGTTLYVVGSFSSVGGSFRQGAAAFDAADEPIDLLPWDPGLTSDSSVSTLASDGAGIYLGGDFRFANDAGVSRKMSAVDPLTGAFVWDSGIADWVNFLKIQGAQMIVGGSFTVVDGEPRSGLALFAMGATPQLIGEDYPGALGVAYPYVSDAAISGNTLYAGGFKYSIGGVERWRLLMVNSQTGEPRPWNPVGGDKSVGGISVIETTDSSVYIAGYFDKIMGENRNRIAAFDMTSGALKPWAPDFGSYPMIHNIVVNGGKIYVAGNFSQIDGQPRNNLAAFSDATGDLLNWSTDLEPSSYVSSMALNGDSLVLVGSPLLRNGVESRLGLVNLETGSFRHDVPQPDTSPWFVKSNGSRVFMCGSFIRVD